MPPPVVKEEISPAMKRFMEKEAELQAEAAQEAQADAAQEE